VKDSSRKWFDEVYKIIRENYLPFCVFNESLTEQDAKFILKNNNPNQIKNLCDLSYRFSTKLPCSDDFYEEKQRVFKELIPELQKRINHNHSAIVFGRTNGDIDIGLISSGLSDKELFDCLQPGSKMLEKYPLVDWDSLFFFKVDSGYNLGLRIIESRLIGNRYEKFDEFEKNYFKKTLDSAEVLYGNKNELFFMKSLKNLFN
jgi:hypothetical protein